MPKESRLRPLYDLVPDADLELYCGPVEVAEDGVEYTGEAVVRFDWHAGVCVEARGNEAPWKPHQDVASVHLPTSRVLDVWPLSSQRRFPVGGWELSGHADPSVGGDIKTPIRTLLFHVANYPKAVFGTEGDPEYRTRASGEDWEIILDAVDDYDVRVTRLRVNRGGAVTHVGALKQIDGSAFSWADTSEPLGALRFLLSFIAGHRIAPLFVTGLDADGRPVIEEWADYRRDPFRGTLSWCTHLLRAKAVRTLWPSVLTQWQDPHHQRLLTVALELYLEAQKGRNVETRLISAQAGLELLAWHFLADHEPRFDPDVVDRKKASWRLRRLLATLNIDPSVPETLTAVRAAWPRADGPNVVCQLRNQITHPKDVGSLLELDGAAKHGVLRLATWYLEMALLRHLGYLGNHLNQTLRLPIFEGKGEPVPWSHEVR